MKTFAAVILAIVVSAVQVWAGSIGDAVEVRIVTDDGRTLPTYPVNMRRHVKKVYAEAVKGDNYRVEVRNKRIQKRPSKCCEGRRSKERYSSVQQLIS